MFRCSFTFIKQKYTSMLNDLKIYKDVLNTIIINANSPTTEQIFFS